MLRTKRRSNSFNSFHFKVLLTFVKKVQTANCCTFYYVNYSFSKTKSKFHFFKMIIKNWRCAYSGEKQDLSLETDRLKRLAFFQFREINLSYSDFVNAFISRSLSTTTDGYQFIFYPEDAIKRLFDYNASTLFNYWFHNQNK